jgi:hypothetical protein
MVSSTEVLRQQPQRIETEQNVELLRSRLELRRRFLAGELTASQVEREEQVEQATCSLAALGARRESLQAQVTRLEQLHAAGAVSSGELQQARADLAAVELDLRLLELELRILQDQ